MSSKSSKYVINIIKSHGAGQEKGEISIFCQHNEDMIIDKGSFFCVFNFFQKTNENKSTWGIIVVKSILFVLFLEESSAWKNHYDFVWPLGKKKKRWADR